VWENNDEMDLEEIGREGKVSICLAQDKNKWQDLFTMVMEFRIP
jgi:hypothetical protein